MNILFKYLLGVGIGCLILSVATRSVFAFTDVSMYKRDSVFPPYPEKVLRYHPDGSDFVIVNGKERFNRALYGKQTSFRIEAGDLPEFSLYYPGIGGTMQLGVITRNGTKWLSDFDTVEARYRPGSMLYKLKDDLTGNAEIYLQLLPMDTAKGMLVKVYALHMNQPVELICVYGGASGDHPSRSGDIGASPRSVFALTVEHSKGNKFKIHNHSFEITYRDRKKLKTLSGIMPVSSVLKIGDSRKLQSPESIFHSATSSAPVLVSKSRLQNNKRLFFTVWKKNEKTEDLNYSQLSGIFYRIEKQREQLVSRVQIHTPDPFLNTLGGAISVASDAIWKSPAYLHGAVAWRMWLNGWRGIFAADDLGWHGRAKAEFEAYNKMQLTQPDTAIPLPDPKYHLARQKEKLGVGIYNSGYITRHPNGKLVPHHYDMNLVYIDALVRHFLWTGDTAFLRKCWPVIKRHLAWEKRNFDVDNNGLFDAYACIWASDALEYSGGDVAYSSAYNYYENKMAARFASILGENPDSYLKEADKIRDAMNAVLWLKQKGWYAEYKDRLGLQLLHPDAGLWSVYHPIDAGVSNAFQTYQLLRYVDTKIPHIPIICKGLPSSFFMLSTTDWMPYVWSVNNVAMAEMANTALAYWEGNRKEKAFRIFKSLILESMYLGSSPGNFEQLSSYDRYRGELYRDFADPIGVSARALVEGLFGIHPDALSGTLTISPGFPGSWNHASIHLPEIDYSFHRSGSVDAYQIRSTLPVKMDLKLSLTARGADILKVLVNGEPVAWNVVDSVVGRPKVEISVPHQDKYEIKIYWNAVHPATATHDSIAVIDSDFYIHTGAAKIIGFKDPQQALSEIKYEDHSLKGMASGSWGHHTVFIQVAQGKMKWWMPVNFAIRPAYQIEERPIQDASGIHFRIINNTTKKLSQTIAISTSHYEKKQAVNIAAGNSSQDFTIPARALVPGTNEISVKIEDRKINNSITNWKIKGGKNLPFKKVDLTAFFNDKVTQIFKNKYISPRPDVPTYQLPVQGIGNWANFSIDPEINDSGLRKLSGDKGYFTLPDGIPFKTPSAADTKNIIFTSQWDNYPQQVTVPVQGTASHAYLLMAGSTNPMQARITNGKVIVHYKDGSADSLLLANPETWWPIAQDYIYGKYAFHSAAPIPFRVHLKTGLITRNFDQYKSIGGFSSTSIPGGAATVLDIPLNKNKKLKSIQIKAVANEVVIGLMGITLIK